MRPSSCLNFLLVLGSHIADRSDGGIVVGPTPDQLLKSTEIQFAMYAKFLSHFSRSPQFFELFATNFLTT